MQISIINTRTGTCGIQLLAYSFRVVCAIFTAHLIRQLRHELGFSSFIYSTAQSLYCPVALSVQCRQ
jgi:hypothetical protein